LITWVGKWTESLGPALGGVSERREGRPEECFFSASGKKEEGKETQRDLFRPTAEKSIRINLVGKEESEPNF